ncbi:carbohydrate sulfotransferase 14-like isoform X2 [Ptychodera flava]
MKFSTRKILAICVLFLIITSFCLTSVGRLSLHNSPRPIMVRPSDVQTSDIHSNRSVSTEFLQSTDVKGDNMNDIASQQTARLNLLHQQCKEAKKKGFKFSQKPRDLYYNDKYEFIFCAVPKVAATSWKRVLLVLNGEVQSVQGLHHMDVQHHHRYPTLNRVSHYQRQSRLATYKKVLFVREPFHRLLSAYRNKFELTTVNSIYRRKYGRYIIQKYREKPISHSSMKDNDVTFPEFVKYLIDPRTTFSSMDQHWRPMFALCNVCNIGYDFIGKFERLQEDALSVLTLIHASGDVTFPDYDTHVTNSSHQDVFSKYYSEVPKDDLVRLYKKYELDFKLFGYDIPTIITDGPSFLKRK